MMFDMRAKPPRSLSRLLNAEPLTQTTVAVWVGLCCVLLATVAYWTVLVDSHRTQRSFTESQSWLRVGQMSHAVSVQVQTLLSGLDYTMRGLESDFADGDADGFRRAVQTTFDAYPAGTFLQIAVADEKGDIVYSNLQQEAETQAAKVSIRDREHFQVHARRENMGMFIGRPVQGRVSHKWTIQLSRALYRQGQFSGVLVLSLSPEYISRYFQSIFDGANDVILLLRTDGTYLARSQGQEAVMGRSVSDVRVALFSPALERGTYEADSSVDGVQRMYAWSRVDGYPLIVSAGLDKKAIFEPLEASLERGLLRNGIGTAVLLLGMLLTLWLARQRQLSERMRLQGERRFARLAQEVPGGLFQFRIGADGQFRFPFTSPGFFELHGAKADAARFADHELLKRVHPEDLPALAASVQASVGSKDVWEHKYRVYGPDGELRWLHGHARPQREEDGSLLWHGYVHDVTQDQAMQESIRHSEERLRLTVGAVRDGLWQWDCRSGHVEWDARCYQMLGFEAAQFPMTYDAFCAMVHPSDRARMLARLQRHAEAGADFRVEMRLRSSADSWLWVESRGEITQRDADGKPVRMLGTHTDIQQRVEQSRLIKALLDRGSALIVMAGPQREILYANERAVQTFGIETDRLPGGVNFRALHVSDESFERFGQLYGQLNARGTVRTEWILRMPSGSGHWFDMQGSLLDPDEDDGRVIWTMIDTDARRRAETALAETQHRLEAIIDRFPAGILVTDAQGRQVLAANRMLAAALRLDMAPAALVGLGMPALIQLLPPSVAGVLSAGPVAGRSLHALPDDHYVEIEGMQLRDGDRSIGHCWVFHDATERQQRESQLETLALTDALTGIPNRRAFMERLAMELDHLRSGLVAHSTLIMLDIDHFKQVNDGYGHAVGDIVLKELLASVAQEMRKEDMVGRLGGEEFAVLLSDTDAEVGLRRAESLRETIAARAIDAGLAGDLHITISLGVYELQRSDASAQGCLERADAALYYSKRNGRNQSTLWSERLPAIAR
ncbi:diguanylate cyclase [Delftia acidovorans]|jgi:diguanylate cyclase (GGDEF)-like protein|uniref:diguanylate cyclase n=1 Tax=Delftia acidovorans TaxID=80866 RepID=UPI003015A7D8